MGFFKWLGNGAKWLANKVKSGWDSVKSVGKKVWDGIKSVPVIGQIAEGIKNFTPIGRLATSIIGGIDAGVGVTHNLVHGNVKGALKSAVGLVNVVPGLNKFAPLVKGISAGVDLATGDVQGALNTAGGVGKVINSGLNMLKPKTKMMTPNENPKPVM